MAAGSAVAMIGANLRFGSGSPANASLNGTRMFQCRAAGDTEAALVCALGALGVLANIALMAVILSKRQLRSLALSALAGSNLQPRHVPNANEVAKHPRERDREEGDPRGPAPTEGRSLAETTLEP